MGYMRVLRDGLQPPILEWARQARRLKAQRGIRYRVYPHAWRAHLPAILEAVDVSSGLVLDVGANEGDWTADVLAVVPDAEVLAIEPCPEVYARVAQRFAGRSNVRVDHRAISSEAGSATFHIAANDKFGSLLDPDPDLCRTYGPQAEMTGTVSVPTVTLDEAVGDRRVSLLKIDVQGLEMAVLKGAERTLASTQAVLIEANFAPHYDGGSRFAEVDPVLSAKGFALQDFSRPFRLQDRLLWADAIYLRA